MSAPTGAVAPGSGVSPGQGQTTIPQLSEGFIDRLIEYTKENADKTYRQHLTDEVIEASQRAVRLARDVAYYEELQRTGQRRAGTVSDSAQVFAEFDRDVVKAVEAANLAVSELSTRNLNPRTALFTITGPFTVRTERELTLMNLALYGLFAMLLVALIVPLACLLHFWVTNALRSRRRQQQPV